MDEIEQNLSFSKSLRAAAGATASGNKIGSTVCRISETEEREARVAELKRQVAGGTYKIDVQSLTHRLVELNLRNLRD